MLEGWLGPGDAEVLVPGPAVVRCCASSKRDHHPTVSAFPPLLRPNFLFLSGIILPFVSTSLVLISCNTAGHGK